MAKKAQPVQPKKVGRPKGSGLAVTPAIMASVCEVLEAGGSRNDAADMTGIAASTLHNALERDADFSERVKKAEVRGKLRHLEAIANSDAWQASAWFLERKYPDEYARREPASKEAAQEIVTALAEFAKRGP